MRKPTKSASRNEIISFCCTFLNVTGFQDYCVNGMQVEGSMRVSRIVTGVSLSEKLIEETIARKAEMLVVHHGIFGNVIPNPPVFRGHWRKRLALLFENNITLCGFHLPLDAHSKIGNNISLCALLGVRNVRPLDVGFIGTLTRAETLKHFVDRVNKSLQTDSIVIDGGSKHIRRIAVISGGASGHFQQAADAGADTFLCGDMPEWNVRAIEETGINVINAGHYNTEKLGVQNLGKLISRKFGIPVEYVDVPCEV